MNESDAAQRVSAANQKFTTFAAAAKTYFGVRPGTGLKEFMAEVKELSDDDKAEIRKGMESHGIIITS